MEQHPVDPMRTFSGNLCLALTELKAGTSLFSLPTQPRGSLGHTLSWGDLNCRKPQEKPREKPGVIFVANLLLHRMLFLFLEKWKGRFSLLSHPYATTGIPQGEQTAATWKITYLGDRKEGGPEQWEIFRQQHTAVTKQTLLWLDLWDCHAGFINMKFLHQIWRPCHLPQRVVQQLRC